MTTQPKYEDVVARLDAALAREAALREELDALEEEFDTLEHTNITIKLSLAVAEQRAGKMEELLREAYEAGDHNIFGTDLDSRIDAELKPAAEGEGS